MSKQHFMVSSTEKVNIPLMAYKKELVPGTSDVPKQVLQI